MRRPRSNSNHSSGQDTEPVQEIASIYFEYKCETQKDEDVFIVGNIKDLGNWEKEKAIQMRTNNVLYPTWVTEKELKVQIGKTIAYKYFIKKPNGEIEYEEIPNNDTRIFTMKKEGNYLISNTKGNTKINLTKKSDEESDPDFADNEEFDEKFKSQRHRMQSLRGRLYSSDSKGSDFLSSQKPIELISYENNKSNNKMHADLLQFYEKQKVTNKDRIINCTVFLPIEVIKENNHFKIVQNEDGSVFGNINYYKKSLNLIWVGMLRSYFSYTEEEIMEIEALLNENGYSLIKPNKDLWNKYIKYTNAFLFPFMVGCSIDENNDIFKDYDGYFKAFYQICRLYANAIKFTSGENDLVILNDIYLALVPIELLRSKINLTVGFYMHGGIPPSDFFSAMPRYYEILNSILQADVIGFHLYDHARNFMTISKRYMGLFFQANKKGLLTVNRLGRTIVLHIKQGQVDVDYLLTLKESQEFSKKLEYAKSIVGNKFSILSLDHLVGVHSIAARFRAIELFFLNHPELADKIIFFYWIKFIDESSTELKDFIENKVKFLNEKYKNKVIHLEYAKGSYEINLRLALFKTCDILLYPFYFEGHTIYANEFISMQNKDKKYFLILGENYNNEGLRSVVKSNPFDQINLAKILYKYYAINLSKEEIEQKFIIDYNFIKKYSLQRWIMHFLVDMKSLQNRGDFEKVQLGLAYKFRVMKLRKKFYLLSKTYLQQKYVKYKNRIIFLDFENTIYQVNEYTSNLDYQSEEKQKNFELPANLKEALIKLSKDEGNLVFVLSKSTKKVLEIFFKDLPSIGLCCENGFCFRYPNETEWRQIDNSANFNMFNMVLPLVKGFAQRTEGSFIVKREYGISWVYQNSNENYGKLQSNELMTHINSLFPGKFELLDDSSCLYIKSMDVDKSRFVAKIIQEQFAKRQVNFILYIGDDNTDEVVFRYLNSVKKYFSNFSGKVKLFNITMGRKPSEANYYIPEVSDSVDLLNYISDSKITEFRSRTLQIKNKPIDDYGDFYDDLDKDDQNNEDEVIFNFGD